MREISGFFLLLIGVLFDLFGCIGLVRLPDIYNRLQAATKCVTLGTCLILIGSAVVVGSAAIVLKSLLFIIFLLITSPTAAHALAKASHASGIRLWEGSVCDLLEEEKEK